MGEPKKSWETESDLGWELNSERKGISRNQDGCATLGWGLRKGEGCHKVIFIQAGDEWGGEEGALIEWQGKGFVKDGVEGDGTHGFSLAESLGWARLDRGARVRATRMVALL
jgi:hypothetical protein